MDVVLVSEYDRQVIGRPSLTIALDVATRCVLSFYVGMERPGAATVGLLLTRAALPKSPWLAKIEADAEWPMSGIPSVLHLDNAAEFKSRALRSGCPEYGIHLMYRPVGRPHFGGHIERLNRTLMERVRGLPGATGSSPKGRKARESEKTASLTLREFEQWLAVEIARRYHVPHRGLLGATPADTWRMLARSLDSRQLPASSDAELRFVIRFLPVVQRKIQADGLTLFHARYWHPIFVAWRQTRQAVTVRYHPEDLSRVFVTAGSGNYLEVRYADMRRPAISLFEHRQRCMPLGRKDSKLSLSSMVLVGTRDAVLALQTDTQMISRYVPFEIPRWRESDGLRRLLAAFERVLPLRKPSDLARREIVQFVRGASGGLTGEISTLLNNAAELSIRNGDEFIGITHLEHVCRVEQ